MMVGLRSGESSGRRLSPRGSQGDATIIQRARVYAQRKCCPSRGTDIDLRVLDTTLYHDLDADAPVEGAFVLVRIETAQGI